MKRLFFLLSLSLTTALAVLTSPAFAERADLRLQMIVLPEATVSSADVRLADISRFSGNVEEYGDLVDLLKGIKVSSMVQPKSNKVIRGDEVLGAIKEAGIALEDILYSVPREIRLTRGGRVVSKSEVLEAVQSALKKDKGLEQIARSIEWDGEQVIPLGEVTYTLDFLGESAKGKMPVRCTATVNNQIASHFLATVSVDDWRAIPILKSQLNRGDVVQSDDLQFVRANLAHYPVDIAMQSEQLVGKRLKRSLPAGEPVRRSEIDLPPMVESGSRVRLVYESGGFTAVAQGIAIDDGSEGDFIQVRNERSNKIIRGKVKTADEIVVTP